MSKWCLFNWFHFILDNGYPHDGRADKNPYPHDRRADKDSYPHDSNNQCIILRLQLSFAMINLQLYLLNWFHIILWYLLDFATNMCQYYYFYLRIDYMLKIVKWSSYYFTRILLLEILHFLPLIDR